jgi:hypothetical protein
MRTPAEIVSEYRYSFRCVTRSEKRRPQRLANGVVPGERFVIGQITLGLLHLPPYFDCPLLVFGKPRIEHKRRAVVSIALRY